MKKNEKIESSFFYALENIMIGFLIWTLIYILFLPAGTGWFKFALIMGAVTGGILLWRAAYEVKAYYYHAYYFFGEFIGTLKPGLFFQRVGGVGGEIKALPKTTVTLLLEKPADVLNLGNLMKGTERSLIDHYLNLTIAITLRIDPNHIENHINHAGDTFPKEKTLFRIRSREDLEKLPGWAQHIISDVGTSYDLIISELREKMKVFSDWNPKQLEKQISSIKEKYGIESDTVDSLRETLVFYGLLLERLNTEVNFPEEERKAAIEKRTLQIREKTRLMDARIREKEVKIAARAEAEAKKIKAEAEAEAKATLDRRLADEFEETVKMLKEHGVPDTVAVEFAMLIHDIVKNEYYLRLSGVDELSKAGGIIAEAISRKLPKATKAVAEDYKKRLQQKNKKNKPPQK